MFKRLKHFACDSRGASAVEYGIIIAMIVLALVGALILVANATIDMWNEVSNEVVQD